jgi:DnaJ homolog subfamily C member 2
MSLCCVPLVAEIGDVDTPIEEVLKFYDYWTNFDSWRDFTGVGAEHDPDSAQDRYEKRRFQQENEKLAKKLKMKEMSRIINLVDRAKQFDPRILAYKEAQKAAKEAQKAAKEALRNQGKNSAPVTPVKEEKVLTKAEKEKIRKLESKIRNTFKKLVRLLADRCAAVAGNSDKRLGEYGAFSVTDIENNLCVNSTMDELTTLNDKMGGEDAIKDAAIVAGFSDEKANELRAALTEQIALCLARIKK